MENYPSNSHKKKDPADKAEPKKIEKVITGEVVRRKKSLSKRFTETFVGGDTRGVGAYILFDVMIPAAKDMMADATSQGVERMLFGEVQSRGHSRRGRSNGHIAYNRMTGNDPRGRAGRADEPRSMSRKSRATHDFDEVILDSRVEADEVIERLYDLISQFDEATVEDFYELVGISSSFTDRKWGWMSMQDASVTRTRGGGYLLNLPRPEPLD